MIFRILAIGFLIHLHEAKLEIPRKPNIVVIMADDMGSHDMSFLGMNQFFTPNIDAMAYQGTIMNHHYTPNLCTPSRAAFMTGKDPNHIGMQHFVIPNDEPWGLPLRETLLPQVLKDNGYKTHLVGKWHLGFFEKDYTPLMRGFDTHFGYYGGYISYFSHSADCFYLKNCNLGKDFRTGFQINRTVDGKYATDLFTEEAIRVIEEHDSDERLFLVLNHLAPHTGSETDPLEAPPEIIEKFNYIQDDNRRKYAAMVHKLDESIGKVFMTLKKKGILDNTIVLFYSDNGAPTRGIFSNSGSNYPLRGQKQSPWEGAILSTAILWSKHIKNPCNIFDQVISVTDWFPTLLKAANIQNHNVDGIDGIDFWDQILGKNRRNIKRRITHVLDERGGYSSIRDSMWKYVNGSTFNGQHDYWLGDIGTEIDRETDYPTVVRNSEVAQVLSHYNSYQNERMYQIRSSLKINCSKESEIPCDPLVNPCLFNIERDPCERINLADIYPDILSDFEVLVKNLLETSVPSVRIEFADPLSNPTLHNNTWTWWRGD